MVYKFGLEYQLKHKVTQEIVFDLTTQVTLQVRSDGGSILSDGNDDATTINTNCSAVTMGTIKAFLNPSINYVAPHVSSTLGSNQEVAQGINQGGNHGGN